MGIESTHRAICDKCGAFSIEIKLKKNLIEIMNQLGWGYNVSGDLLCYKCADVIATEKIVYRND